MGLRSWIAVLALLWSSMGLAQQPAPADMGITPTTVPEVLQVLDKNRVWTPIGTIDSVTHTFGPATNGPIVVDNCLRWGPGIADAGLRCGGGSGGGSSGPLTIYSTHAALAATGTPTGPWTVAQQGFYAPGDNGAAVYQWDATSFCASGEPADGLVCILPSGQSPSTPGRYLLPIANGIDAAQIGFKSDGSDNAPLVHTLSTILSHYPATPVHFPINPAYITTNYWFSEPLELTTTTTVTCGDCYRQYVFPPVNLAFTPGVSGVRVEGYPVPGFDGNGSTLGGLNGCGVIGTGFWSNPVAGATYGSPVIPNTRITTPSALANGAIQPEPHPAIGDGMAIFSGPGYWYFSGSITGEVLTVTSFDGGWSGSDPGIASGQMLQGAGVPIGTFIRSSHVDDPTYTGTGHEGTYRINPSIANPIFVTQANTGTVTAGFNTEVQTGPPLFPPGSTVIDCSVRTGTQCSGGTGTLTMSNPTRLGQGIAGYILPGPNTANPTGSQMFNVSTQTTGHTYGPFTGGISNGSGGNGYNLTITGGPATFDIGQTVMWATTPLSTTTTAPLTFGQFDSIPVASCAGITYGMYVVATVGGQSLFPPSTTAYSCTGTTLRVNRWIEETNYETYDNAGYLVAGSNIATIATYYYAPWTLWVGLPITGANIPPNTIISGPVASEAFAPGASTFTISNAATATSGGQAFNFGGAMLAAPSGTTLNFLDQSAVVAYPGTGAGNYFIDRLGFLAPGSPLYSFDTPSTIYVSGGPRMIQPQELIWSDAFPFGTIAAKIYGSTPGHQTVVTAITNTYGDVAAQVSHTAGSGKMWILPDGLARNTSGFTHGNFIEGFATGINMACAANNEYPQTGCGRSFDTDNFFQYNLVGRLTAGDNSGGASSTNNEYDHNFIADVAELATLGGTYIGEMLQGEDESSNSHDMVSGCLTNASTFTGIYASGAEWEGSCYPVRDELLSSQPGWGVQFEWYGAIYGGPADAAIVFGFHWSNTAFCAGLPTGAFTTYYGIVTRC